jgi:hypothetical protein
MATGTFIACSSSFAAITNFNKKPDLRQYVLRQYKTIVCKLLVAILKGELTFKTYEVP